jgi:hypothetical protein
MTPTTPATDAAPQTSTTTSITSAASAAAVRRWALVLAPVLAGLFVTLGTAFDPAAGLTGDEMFDLYGAHPGQLGLKSLGLHYGYAFLAVPALFVPRLVRDRGAWLATLGAGLAFVGISTLPGLLFVDFYDSAITRLHGADAAAAVADEMRHMWGVTAMALPGMVGSFVGPLVAGLALWRSRRDLWIAPAGFAVGFAAFTVSNATWWGGAVMTVALAGFSVALHRASRPLP